MQSQKEIRIKKSSVFDRTRKAKTRIIVHEGSSRSTKTFSIIQFIIMQHILNKGMRTTICRSKLTWLKSSVVVDFLDIIDNHFKMFNPDSWNKSECIYKLNEGEVAFIGLDEAQKVHGRKQDLFWINEAVECEYKQFEQLVIRTTGQGILDYNPSYEQHWIYDRVIPRDDCTFIKSTYKDNPFLSQEIVKEIERLEPTPENIAQGTADEVSWKIYGLGERAAHKGLIFSRMELCRELPPQNEWKKCFYGLDFGYTNDPTALIQIVYAHGNLYFKQIIYKRGLTNIGPVNSIQQYLIDNGIAKHSVIWADAAEPKSIAELNQAGWLMMKSADKGPDSIKVGIDTINRYKCYVTEDSTDLIKEKNNYKWKEDNTGKIVNTPIDNWNHCFIGDTLIYTSKGCKKIKDIGRDDFVFTTSGFRRVLQRLDNGVKQVRNYTIKTQYRVISIIGTEDHLVRIGSEWKELGSLKAGDKIFLARDLTEITTTNMMEKDITREAGNECIGQYGNFTMGRLKKVFTCITRTAIQKITQLKTFLLLGRAPTCLLTWARAEENGQERTLKKQSPKLLNGIDQKKEGDGTQITQGSQRQKWSWLKKLVRYAGVNTEQRLICQKRASSAEQIAGPEISEEAILDIFVGKKKNEEVFDLHVEDCHEYFASGILVHNCMDALRYGVFMEMRQMDISIFDVL